MSFQAMTANNKPSLGKKQVHPVKLTLEEVYFGCLKRVTFQRRKIGATGDMEVEHREVTIDVKPGSPEGTCFVFEGYVHAFAGPCCNLPSSRACIAEAAVRALAKDRLPGLHLCT